MELKIITHDKSRMGIKATVSVQKPGAGEVYRDEVKLWQANSRKNFINDAIKAANGHLNDIERANYKHQWDQYLRNAETGIKAHYSEEKQRKASAPQSDKSKPLSQVEQDQALMLLRNPSLLFMLSTFLLAIGLAGEKINALILYLVMTSRLLRNILSAVVKAESSSGKNTVIEKVAMLFPDDARVPRSGLSKQALIYTDQDYSHKHIIIAEAEGARAATYSIRTLLSENQLVFETVEKDADGKLVARTIKKDGPTGLITATTLARLHPENETRLLSLALDESEEQTKRVKKATAARYQNSGEEIDRSVWINAQRVLRPVKVVIPFADYLSDHTPDNPIRIRRDFNKLLSVIEASATLHQYQRHKIGDGIIEASLADYYIALVLMEKAFFSSLYGIHPNTVRVMEAIKLLDNHSVSPIETRNLMDHLGWSSKSTVLRWAAPLEDYDWIIKGGNGKPDTYRVGIDPRDSTQRLPSIEEMAEQFPELAEQFTIVHPLTGETFNLANDQPESSDPVDGDQPVAT